MRVLVALHQLELGGSQLNALDLALQMRKLGHEMALFGVYAEQPGAVAEMAREAGLSVVLTRHPLERTRRVLPCRPSVARALGAAAIAHRADLLHAYEYPMFLDAFHGPHRRWGTPVAATIYAMTVPKWIPRYPELVVGTQGFVEEVAAFRARPTLIEPPVDTEADDPLSVDPGDFRREHGIAPDDIAVVVVSRLEAELKAEGVARAIAAVERLRDPRVRLVIVGSGPSEEELRTRAEASNAALGRRAVVMTGALRDPRPAYAAADIALGMGGSALRALAFGRPLIVLGVRGFSRPYTPETADSFRQSGFFGEGPGDLDAAPLAGQIRELAEDLTRRRELGAWSRRLVLERYSVESAARVLEDVYRRAVDARVNLHRRRREALRIAAHRAVADVLPRAVRERLREALS